MTCKCSRQKDFKDEGIVLYAEGTAMGFISGLVPRSLSRKKQLILRLKVRHSTQFAKIQAWLLIDSNCAM